MDIVERRLPIQTFISGLIGDTNPRPFVGLIALFFGWMLSVLRIAKDANARTESLPSQIGYVLLALIPILGPALYILIRPPSYRYDTTPRREAILMQTIQCPVCGELNPRDHAYCLACGHPLQTICKTTGKPYPRTYDFSPYSGEPNVDLGDDEELDISPPKQKKKQKQKK